MIAALAAVIVGATTLWVLAPILGWTAPREDEGPSRTDSGQEELLEARRQLLASIKDLEMEFRTGKLTQEDYEQTRERLTREAVEVLKKIDQGGSGP
jgi:hypothetical protein